MTEHISCDFKRKFNSAICSSNQKWNNTTCQNECKNYRKCKKDYSRNPNTFICENSKCLKSIANTSITECDEIIIVIDAITTKNANTIATNVRSTASINRHSKKVKECYILHRVLLVVILLLIIIIMQTKRRNIK